MNTEVIFLSARVLVATMKGACMAPKSLNPITHYQNYQTTAFWGKTAAWSVCALGIIYCKLTQTKKPKADSPYEELHEPTQSAKIKAYSAGVVGLIYAGYEYYRFAGGVFDTELPLYGKAILSVLLLTTTQQNINLARFAAESHYPQLRQQNPLCKRLPHINSPKVALALSSLSLLTATIMRMVVTRMSIAKLKLGEDPNLQFNGFNLGNIIQGVAFYGFFDAYVRATNNLYQINQNQTDDIKAAPSCCKQFSLVSATVFFNFFYAINDAAQYTNFFGQISWYLGLFIPMTLLTMIGYHAKTADYVDSLPTFFKPCHKQQRSDNENQPSIKTPTVQRAGAPTDPEAGLAQPLVHAPLTD